MTVSLKIYIKHASHSVVYVMLPRSQLGQEKAAYLENAETADLYLHRHFRALFTTVISYLSLYRYFWYTVYIGYVSRIL